MNDEHISHCLSINLVCYIFLTNFLINKTLIESYQSIKQLSTKQLDAWLIIRLNSCHIKPKAAIFLQHSDRLA
jgi:hypothetical protein